MGVSAKPSARQQLQHVECTSNISGCQRVAISADFDFGVKCSLLTCCKRCCLLQSRSPFALDRLRPLSTPEKPLPQPVQVQVPPQWQLAPLLFPPMEACEQEAASSKKVRRTVVEESS